MGGGVIVYIFLLSMSVFFLLISWKGHIKAKKCYARMAPPLPHLRIYNRSQTYIHTHYWEAANLVARPLRPLAPPRLSDHGNFFPNIRTKFFFFLNGPAIKKRTFLRLPLHTYVNKIKNYKAAGAYNLYHWQNIPINMLELIFFFLITH